MALGPLRLSCSKSAPLSSPQAKLARFEVGLSSVDGAPRRSSMRVLYAPGNKLTAVPSVSQPGSRTRRQERTSRRSSFNPRWASVVPSRQ